VVVNVTWEKGHRPSGVIGQLRRCLEEESGQGLTTGLQPLRHDLLQSARGFYEEFVRERSDDPTLRAELAAAQLRLGLIDIDLGLESTARRSLDGAIAAYEAAVRDNPNDLRLKEGLGDAWYALGQLYWDTNNEESRNSLLLAGDCRILRTTGHFTGRKCPCLT
jgi:tetratricopeptide (TPR) repeat protein